jgi:undecaprenyl diphosphate synthase
MKQSASQPSAPSGLHVGIIVDGNGRWATRQGRSRSAGHREGAAVVRRIVEAAPDAGIGVLTLFAFSADNWRRPPTEVNWLMRLFREYLRVETARCRENGVRLEIIGRRDRLADPLRRTMESAERATAAGDRLHLRIALDYSARDAILRALGLRGVEVRRVPELPRGLGRNLALGSRVTLGAARAATPFRLLLPARLGRPDEVYRSEAAPGGQVALVWRARPGLPRAAETGLGALLTEVRGSGTRDFVRKLLGPGSRAEPVSVAGHPGLWLTGAPHGLGYLDARGIIRAETLRLAGDTLIWERNGLVLRLESALSKRDAIALGASLR